MIYSCVSWAVLQSRLCEGAGGGLESCWDLGKDNFVEGEKWGFKMECVGIIEKLYC